MKKIIALLMAVLMTAGMLAACSSTPAEDASPTVENTKAQAETAVVSGEKGKGHPEGLGGSGRAGADRKALQRICRRASREGIHL